MTLKGTVVLSLSLQAGICKYSLIFESKRTIVTRNSIIRWTLACIFFAAVFIAYTWPLAKYADSRIIGRLDMQSDVPVFYNNIYLFEKKVTAGESPLHNDMEMYPEGFNMTMN